MKVRSLSALTIFLLILAAAPAFSQVCYLPQYANTIACLPTRTADMNTFNVLINKNGAVYNGETELPAAVPLALGYQFASQISTAPSAATSAGYVFTFEKGALSAKPADLGPLFSDLPQTIGRHRMYVGTSYQWMQFTRIGGKDIKSFPYYQALIDPDAGTDPTTGDTVSIEVWHENQASASLKVHNVDTYVSYGITDRLEVSAVIPWSHVGFGVSTGCLASDSSDLTINGQTFCTYPVDTTALDEPGLTPLTGWYDVFFFNPGSESLKSKGIGDLTLRGKYEFIKEERQGLAFGLEYRLPTGDPLNLRGSGATGLRPFLAWGYNGRISPHANIGFQYNGSSVNDVRDTIDPSSGEFSNKLSASKLPNAFTASAGADLALNRRLNVDADLLERVFSNDGSKAFMANAAGLQVPVAFSGASNKSTVVVGAKGKLADHFLVGVNLMIDATSNTGMSYKPSPVVTLSYDFGTTK